MKLNRVGGRGVDSMETLVLSETLALTTSRIEMIRKKELEEGEWTPWKHWYSPKHWL